MGKFGKLLKISSLGILKSLGAFYSHIAFELKELPGVREFNQAGGLKSMIMAFQGKSAKQIELEEIYNRIKKEEQAKARVHQEYLKEHGE
jgi:hypothetical protein